MKFEPGDKVKFTTLSKYAQAHEAVMDKIYTIESVDTDIPASIQLDGLYGSFDSRNVELVTENKFKVGDRVEYINKDIHSKQFIVSEVFPNTVRFKDEIGYHSILLLRLAPETISVSKDFILAAHKAACADWKQKIEKQVPELFLDKFEQAIIAIQHTIAGERFSNETGDYFEIKVSKDNLDGMVRAYNWIDKFKKAYTDLGGTVTLNTDFVNRTGVVLRLSK